MFTAPNMMMTTGLGAPVTIVGTPVATDLQTIAIPTHAVGQLIILIVTVSSNGFSDITKPSAGGTVPAWVTGFDVYNSDGAMGIFWYIATATNHTSGTWGSGSATNIVAMVAKNHSSTTPIGMFKTSHGNGTGVNVPAPAIAAYDFTGLSMLLKCHEVVGLNGSNWDAAPAGYTRRAASATFGGRSLVVNTRDDTTSDALVNEGPNVGNNWIASTIEIISQDTNAILFDSASDGVLDSSGTTSTPYNHPVATNGADVFVTTVTRTSSRTATGVTCGGVAMTQVASQANNNNGSTSGTTQLWRLAKVSAGNKSIVATWSGSVSSSAVSSAAYLNVNSVSAATTSSGSSSTAVTQAATVPARQVALQVFGASDANGGLAFTMSSNAGGTERANNSSGPSTYAARCIMNDYPASVTFSMTPGQTVAWAAIYILLSS